MLAGFTRRAALLAAGGTLAAPAFAQTQPTRLRLTLDWAFQSPNAFALLAREKGYFREAGLDVQIDRGQGSGGVPVALAGGSYDMGYADLNPAIRFMAENPDRGIVAVAGHARPLPAMRHRARRRGRSARPRTSKASAWPRRISTPGASCSRPSPAPRASTPPRSPSCPSRPRCANPCWCAARPMASPASSPPRRSR
jgi:hypothetical protein